MRPPSSWPGLVAVILAVTIGGGWCTALVLSATPMTDTISEQGADLLATIGGVLAGGLVTYLGSQIRHNGRADTSPAAPPGDVVSRSATRLGAPADDTPLEEPPIRTTGAVAQGRPAAPREPETDETPPLGTDTPGEV